MNKKGRYLYGMYFVLIMILLTAAGIDMMTNKIPNRVIVCGIASGVLCRFMNEGISGFFFSISGIFVPSVFLLVLYGCGMIGAGDVKLMSVTGSFLGVIDCVRCLLPILFFAGILSCVCFFGILLREKKDALLKFHVIPMAVPVLLGVYWHLCKFSV